MLAASTAKQERLQQLRLNIALKKKEIEELESKKVKLQEKAGDHTGALLDKLVADRKAAQLVPLAQVGNVVSLCIAATQDQADKAKVLRKTIAEIELQMRYRQRELESQTQRREAIVKKTGFTTSQLAPKVKVLPAVTVKELDDALHTEQMAISATKLLIQRQRQVVETLENERTKRKNLYDEVMTTMNAVLVRERDTNEAKEELRELLVQHAELDLALKAAAEAQDHTSVAIMQIDVDNCRRASTEVVEERRATDRVLKAQEARLVILDSRLSMIRDVLGRHDLLTAIDSRLVEHFNAMSTSPSDVPEIDDETLQRYSSVDALMPDVEHLPASILALFQHDLAIQQKRLRVKELMLREKEDTRNALLKKIAELQKTYDGACDDLHEHQLKTDAEVDAKRAEAHTAVLQLKRDYDAALVEAAALNAKLEKQRKADEERRAEARRKRAEAASSKRRGRTSGGDADAQEQQKQT